eukprot:g5121.t1
MTDPVSLAFNTVNGLLSRIKDVKTNHEGCQLFANLAEKSLKIVEQLNENLSHPEAAVALTCVTDALTQAHDAIDKCYNANFIFAMVYRERYASYLKHAAERLRHALSSVSLTEVGMSSNAQSDLDDLSHQLSHAKFEEKAAMSHQFIELRDAFERASFQKHQENAELRHLLQTLVQKHKSTLKFTDELKKLHMNVFEAKQSKEFQMEFELNAIIQAVSESLEDVPQARATKTRAPKKCLKDCICCPITKDIMKDPVIVMESGNTYDRSSIEEWFDRGHSTDPLSNKKLESTDLIPDCSLQDICLDYLDVNQSYGFRMNRRQFQKPKLKLELGLYEGHGKLTIGTESICIFQTLLLEPLGKIIGYTLYKRENCKMQTTSLEVGNGTWDGSILRLVYEDGLYIYKGIVDPELNQKIKWTGKVVSVANATKESDFHFFYSLPPLGHKVWPQPGVFQVRGVTSPIDKTGGQVANLLISLGTDSTISGWIWFQSPTQDLKDIGRITCGSWNSTGHITIDVLFPVETISLHSESMSSNCSLKLDICNDIGEANSLSSLSAIVKVINKANDEDILRDITPSIGLEDVQSLKNLCISEASIQGHNLHPNWLGVFQVLKDDGLTSKAHFSTTRIAVNYGFILYSKHAWEKTLLHFASTTNFSSIIKETIAKGANIDCQDNNGNTSLHLALSDNSIDAIEELIANKASIYIQNNDGSYPLHIAAQNKCLKALKKILTLEKDISLRESNEWNPLHTTTSNERFAAVKKRIKKCPYINLQDNNGRTPLHIASQENSIDVVKELIANGANIHILTKDGWAPLHSASQKNSIDVVKELIAHGANIDLQENNGASPLYIATLMSSIDVAKELIARGANINLKNKKGSSPLYLASKNNSVDVVKELIAKGANIHRQSKNGLSPLHFAAHGNAIDVVKELITRGADIHLQNKNGSSPLHFAANSNAIDVVKELTARGANIHLLDQNGSSPLHLALQQSHVDGAKELIARGANIQLQDKTGRSPLHLSLQKGHVDVAKELIARGVNIHLQDKTGRSPLHLALQQSHLDVAKELIARGVNIHLQDKNGEFPFRFAANGNAIHVVKELIARGADIHLLDMNNSSSLHIALPNANAIHVVKELIARGADVRLQDKNRSSPVHIAIIGNAIDVVKVYFLIVPKLNTFKELFAGKTKTSFPEVETHVAGTITGLEYPGKDCNERPSSNFSGDDASLDRSRNSLPDMNFFSYGGVNDESEKNYLDEALSERIHTMYEGNIKIVVKESNCKDSNRARKRLDKEARIHQRLNGNSHIVRFLGTCVEHDEFGEIYTKGIKTEWCQLGALRKVIYEAKWLEQLEQDGKAISDFMERASYILYKDWIKRMNIIIDVAAGMVYMHNCNVVHRDLNSINILLDSIGSDGDFIAKIRNFERALYLKDSEPIQRLSSHVNSVPWMGPEVLRIEKYGLKADIYSIGTVLWELMYLANPWTRLKEIAGNDDGFIQFLLTNGTIRLPVLEEGAPADVPEFPRLVKLVKSAWYVDPDDRPTMIQFYKEVVDIRNTMQERVAEDDADE